MVIYLPGFDHPDVHKTPALELYRAGDSYRMGLETVVREAAVGQVLPKALDAFLGSGELTLAAADAWLAKAALAI